MRTGGLDQALAQGPFWLKPFSLEISVLFDTGWGVFWCSCFVLCVPSRLRRLLLVSSLVWVLLHCWSNFLVEYGRRWFPDTEKKVLGTGKDQG